MNKNFLSIFTHLTYYGKYDFSYPKRPAQADACSSRDQVERSSKKSFTRTSTQIINYGRAHKEQQTHRTRRKRDWRYGKTRNQKKTRLVIDTNRIIAALIKESTTRKIIFDERYEFIAPEHLVKEVEKHKPLITKKSQLPRKTIDTLLKTILKRIRIIPEETYQYAISQAQTEIRDEDDIVFVALAIAKQANIWSDDKGFNTVRSVKVYTTKYLAL